MYHRLYADSSLLVRIIWLNHHRTYAFPSPDVRTGGSSYSHLARCTHFSLPTSPDVRKICRRWLLHPPAGAGAVQSSPLVRGTASPDVRNGKPGPSPDVRKSVPHGPAGDRPEPRFPHPPDRPAPRKKGETFFASHPASAPDENPGAGRRVGVIPPADRGRRNCSTPRSASGSGGPAPER